jgi:chromosome segregation ATPase
VGAAPAAAEAALAAANGLKQQQQQQQQQDVDMDDVQEEEQQQQQDSRTDASKVANPAASEQRDGVNSSRQTNSDAEPLADGAPTTRSSRGQGDCNGSTGRQAQKEDKKNVGRRSAGRRNARVLDSSSSEESGAEEEHVRSGSSSASKTEMQPQRQSGRKRRQQQQEECDREQDTDKAATHSFPSAAALAKQGQQLQQRQQQLEDAQHEWQSQTAKVNEAALERDLQALQVLAAAHAQLQQLQQQQDEAVSVREQLLDERYARLLAVLQALNASLDGVYRQLTGGCGSAYCAYTQVGSGSLPRTHMPSSCQRCCMCGARCSVNMVLRPPALHCTEFTLAPLYMRSCTVVEYL